MPVGAAIGASAVISGGASIIAGNKAASATKNAAATASETERYMYDTSRADYAPWRETGKKALAGLEQAYGLTPSDEPYGGFFTSPGYEFRRDEGIKALDRSAAARGQRTGPVYGNSGAHAKAIARYGEGLAASEYDAYSARLAQLAGFGQSATAGTAEAGSQAARGISTAQMAAGNARASSYLNTGSAVGQTASNLAGAYLYSQGAARVPKVYDPYGTGGPIY